MTQLADTVKVTHTGSFLSASSNCNKSGKCFIPRKTVRKQDSCSRFMLICHREQIPVMQMYLVVVFPSLLHAFTCPPLLKDGDRQKEWPIVWILTFVWGDFPGSCTGDSAVPWRDAAAVGGWFNVLALLCSAPCAALSALLLRSVPSPSLAAYAEPAAIALAPIMRLLFSHYWRIN